MISAMQDQLELDPRRCVVVTIDLQRGALDPEIATLPIPDGERQRVLDGATGLVRLARAAGIPVVHVVTAWEQVELASHPFEQAMLAAKQAFTPSGAGDYARHKLVGSPEAQLMPELGPETGDYIVDSKRRFDMFYGTNLEGLLRSLGVDTILLSGVNTNTCVLGSTFGAYSRDLRVVVIADAVASAYGQDLHWFALQNVQRRLGWVLTLEELAAKLNSPAPNLRSGLLQTLG
jgi:nicotinamidase-related amidase